MEPQKSTKSASCTSRRFAMMAVLGIFLALFSTLAQAQWQVTDQATEKNTQQTQNNTNNISNQIGGSTSNESTDNLDQHLINADTIGTTQAPASSSSSVPAPSVALVAAPAVDTSSCNSAASSQTANCQEIIKTQNAQYAYLKSMYDETLSRESDLQALVKARNGMGSEDLGKLVDNTNKIEALRAQIEIDRQQMESVNLAYQTRIVYLQQQQAQLANTAATGSSPNNPVSSVIGNMVSGAVLAGTLQALIASQDVSGEQTLSVEQSNGW